MAPGRRVGQRRLGREPARRVARARARRDLPPGLAGGRGARRGVRRLDLLVRRRHHRLVRPRAAGRHQRARPAALRQRRPLRLRGSADARPSTGWSPTAPCRSPTAPTTAWAWSTAARSSWRPSPSSRARAPTWCAARATRPSRSGSSRGCSPAPDLGSPSVVGGVHQLRSVSAAGRRASSRLGHQTRRPRCRPARARAASGRRSCRAARRTRR